MLKPRKKSELSVRFVNVNIRKRKLHKGIVQNVDNIQNQNSTNVNISQFPQLFNFLEKVNGFN